MVYIVALTNPIDEEKYQDYGNNMVILPPFTGLLPYIRAAVGHFCICISEDCLKYLSKHLLNTEQQRKSANEKAEKRGSGTYCSAVRPGRLIKITVFTEEEGGDGEEMLKTEEETRVTAPTADRDIGRFICGALGHWARDCPPNEDYESPHRGHQLQRGKGHHDQCPRSAASSQSNRRHQSAVNGKGQSAGVETQQNSNRLTTHYTMHCNFYPISAHTLNVFSVHGAFKRMPRIDEKPWSPWWLPSCGQYIYLVGLCTTQMFFCWLHPEAQVSNVCCPPYRFARRSSNLTFGTKFNFWSRWHHGDSQTRP